MSIFHNLQWMVLRRRPGAVSVCALSVTFIVMSASSQTFARGMHQNNNNQQQAPQKPEPKPVQPDDPAVHDPMPPAADASLLTKVGWCEVQVFGHTFSDSGLVESASKATHMPLPKRLEQISRKIEFEPQKSGMQLMDDVNPLIKAVSSAKKESAAGSSKAATSAASK
jgi:hypothetical protein